MANSHPTSPSPWCVFLSKDLVTLMSCAGNPGQAWRQFIWDGLDAPSEPSDRDLPLMFDVLCPEIADTAELVTNQGRKFISLLDKVVLMCIFGQAILSHTHVI